MPTTTLEQEMTALETKYWQAMKDSDVQAAQRATTDPCVVAGASGVATVDGRTFAQMMSGASWRVNDFELSDVQARELTADVRIVAYKVHEALAVEGKPVSIDAADASVWVREGGEWRCALHTESLLGDAYGRDRR